MTARRRVAGFGVLALLAALVVPTAAAQASVNLPYGVFAHGDAVDGGIAAPAYPGGRFVSVVANPSGAGYWALGADGTVYPAAGAPAYGSATAAFGWVPAAALAPNPNGPGYWVASAAGDTVAVGGAPAVGSQEVGTPVTAAAANPHGPGLWLVTAGGAVVALGGAPAFGGLDGALGFVAAVGIAPNPSGPGYWLVASDGRVFAFGGAPATGPAPPGAVAAASRPGGGLWVLGASGAVIALGGAPSFGATVAPIPFVPAAGIAATPTGNGYWTLFSPPPPPPRARDEGPRPPDGSGSGRRIVYANGAQRIWLVNDDDSVYRSYLVSGRAGVPSPGTYRVYYKGTGWAGNLRLDYFVGFAHGSGGGEIGFHRIPVRPDGSEIQPRSLLGTFQSHGCVRMALEDVQVLYDWVAYGDPVVVVG